MSIQEVMPPAIGGNFVDPKFEQLSPAEDVYRKALDTETREVLVESEIGIEHYEALAEQLGPWAARDLKFLKELASSSVFEGKRIEEVNPTANGGGVQMILMAQINMMRKLGVDARWRLMLPDEEAFKVTKYWHNTSQDVQGLDGDIEEGKPIYERWIDENAEALQQPLSEADIVTIHDPQPHGLIPFIKQWNPNAKMPWRDHIQTSRELIGEPGSPQEQVWRYWFDGKVEQADFHIFHPVDHFVPAEVPADKVIYAPATFDPFDDLNNLNLTPEEKQAGRDFFDEQLLRSAEQKPADGSMEESWEQLPIDWNRPMMALIARFDPAKGMPEAINAYAMARQKMEEQGLPQDRIPQIVITGNGSIDDPDGEAELAKMMSLRSGLPGYMQNDVKVVRVPHNDKAINTLMCEADFGLQPSLKEGFETRATDWIWHGKPVITSNRGGLPLQVHEGESGFVVDPDNIEGFAQRMYDLSTNPDMRQYMSQRAEELGKTYNYREFSTVGNSIRWLLMYRSLLAGEKQINRENWKISDIVDGTPGQIGSLAVATS